MRTPVARDDALLDRAAMIERESARRLARLGGTAQDLPDIPRRHPDDRAG